MDEPGVAPEVGRPRPAREVRPGDQRGPLVHRRSSRRSPRGARRWRAGRTRRRDHPPSLPQADHGAFSVERAAAAHGRVRHPFAGYLSERGRLRLGELPAAEGAEADGRSASAPTTTFSSTGRRRASERFIPIMATPFWDVDLCVDEMRQGEGSRPQGRADDEPARTSFDFPRHERTRIGIPFGRRHRTWASRSTSTSAPATSRRSGTRR